MRAKRLILLLSSILLFYSLSYSTNVIIIAVDTLRADHLSCYGYPINTSPNIDQLAQDGVRFMRCFTPSPLTTPAFASMLSSLAPYKHGAKRNGMSVFNRIKILPQYLKNHGYYSGAFISNYTLKKDLTRLNRGFDTYTDILNKRRWLKLFLSEGDAKDVSEKASKWLHQNAERKFFLWVHYTSPHEPYVYHKEFDRGHQDVDPSVYPQGSHLKKIRKYDTEIGYDDHYIGVLIRKIKELGLYEDSLIIFMADHGESFGEHNYFTHGRKLYNSTLHVPLVVKLPGNKNAHTVTDRHVSLLDIAPTIFAQLGIPTPDSMEGEDLFDPKSAERVFYFEAYRGVVDSQKGELFHLKVNPIRYGLLKGKMKLIYDGKYEAYDIEKDFFESRNIYRNPDSEMEVLSGMLAEFISTVKDFIKYSRKYFKQKSKLTKEEIEKLKSLGYIKK